MREERPVGASTLGRGNSSIPPSQILLIIPYHTSYHRLSLSHHYIPILSAISTSPSIHSSKSPLKMAAIPSRYPESSSSSSSLKPNDFIKSPILHPKTSISVSPSPEDTTDKLTMTTIPSRYPTEDPLLSVSAKQPDFSKTPEISPTNNFSASVTDKYLGNNGNSTTSPIPSRYPPLSPISRAADSNSSNEDILSEKVSDKSFSYSSTQSSSLSLTPTPSCRNLPASAFPTSSTSSLSLVHQTIQSNASDHKSVLSAATESKHSLPISPQGSISSINSNSKKQNKVKNAMNSLLRKFRVSNKAKENIGDLRNEIDELRFLNMVGERRMRLDKKIVKDMKIKESTLRSQMEEMESSIQIQQSKLKQLLSMNSELFECIERLHSTHQTETANLHDMVTNFQQRVVEYQYSHHQSQAVISQQQQDLRASDAKLMLSERDVLLHRQRYEQTLSQLHQKEKVHDKLKTEFDLMRKQFCTAIQESVEQGEQLHRDLGTDRQKCLELEEQLRKQNDLLECEKDRLNRLLSSLNSLMVEKSEADRTVKERVQEITNLSREASELKRQLKDSMATIESLKSELSVSEQQSKDKECVIEQLKCEKRNIQADNERLRMEMEAGFQNYGQLKKQYEDILSKNSALEQTLKSSKEDNSKLKTQLTSVEEENIKLNVAARVESERVGRLEEKMNSLARCNAELEEQLAKAVEASQSREAELHKSLSDITATNEEQLTTLLEYEKLGDSFSRLKSVYDLQTQKFATCEASLAQKNQFIAQLQEELKRRDNMITYLQREVVVTKMRGMAISTNSIKTKNEIMGKVKSEKNGKKKGMLKKLKRSISQFGRGGKVDL